MILHLQEETFHFAKFRFDSENSSTSAENCEKNRNLNSYILDKLIVEETVLGLEKPLVIQQNLFEVDEKGVEGETISLIGIDVGAPEITSSIRINKPFYLITSLHNIPLYTLNVSNL